MKHIISSIPLAYSLLVKNKINLLLSLVPVLVGLILYYLLGSWIFGTVIEWGRNQITQYIGAGSFGTVVYYLLSVILSIAFFFIVNWTFVLVVAVISSPFNDIISSRIEKQLYGMELDSIGDSFKSVWNKLGSVFLNEVKKISMILLLTVFGLILSFFPLFAPVSIAIAALLLSVEFIDYSWSRHAFKFRDCVSDTRKNIFSYLVPGWAFTFLMTVPVLNIFMLPFGIGYFTVLWCKNNEGFRS